ncbi:unnamed protein product [Linum tenue]|uniref:Cytochrome P450 n=1 Tax=Linum tenue TaxID=586396 RepID=A0AAV0NAA4_9ROSI|nr:unnamed protein product [Linum tenue]
MRQLAEKYGPVMQLQLGEVTNVIISTSEAAKLVMQTHELVFASRLAPHHHLVRLQRRRLRALRGPLAADAEGLHRRASQRRVLRVIQTLPLEMGLKDLKPLEELKREMGLVLALSNLDRLMSSSNNRSLLELESETMS